MDSLQPATALAPLAYQLAVRDYLKAKETALWDWFASAQSKASYTSQLRQDLLKSTYRLDRSSHADLHAAADEVQSRLGLNIPLTLYQAQESSGANAALLFLPNEGHIVLSGPLLTLLTTEELKAILGHELAHHHLWHRDSGELLIADRLLQAMANDPRAAESHLQTARRFRLYTEIFADRGALLATGSIEPVIASLMKLHTGLRDVSAAAYLKQADEIFAHGNFQTEGNSHPEPFVRARALQRWHQQGSGAEASIAEMIEGQTTLHTLDLLAQQRLTDTTRQLLHWMLRPTWMHSPALLGHARLFFPDFDPRTPAAPVPAGTYATLDETTQEYLSRVLLDFCTADPDLHELPLAFAIELAGSLGIGPVFERVAPRELQLRPKEFRKLKAEAAAMIQTAEAQP